MPSPYGYTSVAKLSELFENAFNKRQKGVLYPNSTHFEQTKFANALNELKDLGITIIPGFIEGDFKLLLALRHTFDELVLSKTGLSRIRNHVRDFSLVGHFSKATHFTPSELKADDTHLKHKTNLVSIADPFVSFPALTNVVLNSNILSFAVKYFGAVPLLSYCKVTHSFANDLPDSETQFWHFDYGSKKILKCIIYLNDVNMHGGPFSFVIRSHVKRFRGWNLKSHYTDAEVAKYYGQGQVKYCTANLGDIVFAETTGLHKGLKPKSSDRAVLIFNFTMHPEVGFPWNKIKIPFESYSHLTDFQKSFISKDVFEFLN